MKRLIVVAAALSISGCATLTEDAMTPIALSFSDGSSGNCNLTNKRGIWETDVPTTVSVRKSDDALKYDCETSDGREAVGTIASEMGAKIVASAVFLDLGITDAITDKHRKYADSYVIPIVARNGDGNTSDESSGDNSEDAYQKLNTLNDLKERGVITEEEFEVEKKKILGAE